MSRFLYSIVLLIACFAYAQDDLCRPPTVSIISQGPRLTVKKVTLNGPWGNNDATALFPAKDRSAKGGVVFSHSKINWNEGTRDMFPMAITLAVAGAAVILPNRTLTWLPTEDAMNREGAVVICATRWLPGGRRGPGASYRHFGL